jgi:hypothetical protein
MQVDVAEDLPELVPMLTGRHPAMRPVHGMWSPFKLKGSLVTFRFKEAKKKN